MKKLLLLIVSFLMVSCASTTPSSLEIPPPIVSAPKPVPVIVVAAPPKSMEAPGSALMTVDNNVLYKAFLFPSDKLKTDLATFIYLPKKPVSEEDIKQYILLCKVWMSSFSTQEELAPYTDPTKEKLVPLYWAVSIKPMKPNCEDMIKRYDYPRMFMVMQRNKLDTNKIQLVSIYKDVTVTMNITPLKDPDDLVGSFVAWKTYMTKTPTKNEKVDPISLTQSLKKVLGALGHLVTTNLKG